MNELVIMKHDEIFTDSLVVAKETENQHNSVTRILRKYSKDFKEFGKLGFEIQPSDKGQPQRVFQLNEQQATLLMTYLGNSEIVRRFKIRLVQEFFKMRQALMQRQTASWVESREQSKLTRKSETDVLKEFIEYAQMQGSTHAGKYYMIFSKLANKMANINDRNMATILELNNLNYMESIILNVVREEMAKGTHYKDIYKACNNRLEQFTSIAYLKV